MVTGTCARTIREYLLSNSPWVDPERTVDTVKAGDPDREVHKAGVCWFASLDTIRAAADAGCDLLICHEPVFWEHDAAEKLWRDKAPGLSKARLLQETGIVILRVHDCWDQWPELGIRDSWAAHLELTERVFTSTEHRYHAIYAIPDQTLKAFAQYVAERVRTLGEDSVRVMGEPDLVVKRPAIGVGCIGPDKEIVEAGADVLIVCYDGAPYWAVRERLYEMGVAVIAVEHGTSEMPGLENLCRYLAQEHPHIEFLYFANHPKPWTVMGKR